MVDVLSRPKVVYVVVYGAHESTERSRVFKMGYNLLATPWRNAFQLDCSGPQCLAPEDETDV